MSKHLAPFDRNQRVVKNFAYNFYFNECPNIKHFSTEIGA